MATGMFYPNKEVAYVKDPSLYGKMKLLKTVSGRTGFWVVEVSPETPTHDARYEVFSVDELAPADEYFVQPAAPLVKV